MQRIEARQQATRDLSARFVQTYSSGLLGHAVVERGTLKVKRPGRMLWEYRDPERKTFVSDGTTFFFYVPADKQVIVRDQKGDQGVAAGLLSGQWRLGEQFECSLEAGGRLRLVPRRPEAAFEQAFVDSDSEGRILGIEVLDAQGSRSRFRFEAIRENVGLSDTLFRFTPPPGVEVITG